jgi:lipopolysaccharide export system protein LptA
MLSQKLPRRETADEKTKMMGVTLASLRTWIAVIAGVLVAAIVGFFVYDKWQGRHLGHDRPYGLGTSVQQSTNGFTYSESRGGHTIYNLHASKAVQYKKDGHLELHDVSITLYNAQGAASSRIYGSDFDWDPVHGTALAMGEVQIDFQGSPAPAAQAGKAPEDEGEDKNTVHIKTSGLVFNKQTGLASTPERIEFRLAEAAGSATGASFDSQSGIMILTADVAFNSSVGGSPLAVHAHHAQFDRASHLLYLLQDVTDYADSHSSSDQATVSFRADGSAYQVEAQGNVVITGSDGQQINTRKAHIDLGPKSEPQQAVLDGGLLYVSNNALRLLHGSASSGTLLFGPQSTVKHAQLRDAVSVVDEEKLPPVAGAPGKPKQNAPESSTRQVGATTVDVDFASGPDRQPMAEHILAVGGAQLNVHTIYAKTPPEDTTVKGDQLFATLVDGEVLSSLRGTGHTSLVDITPSGIKQSSTGDNLLLTFAPPQLPPAKPTTKASKAKTNTPAPQQVDQLQSAVQVGNVTLTQETPQETPAKPADATAQPGAGAPTVTTAVAQRAAYDAASQVVQLSGDPRIRNASGELSAALIEMERTTGNANATGGVKATYRQSSGQQQPAMAFTGAGPVHVVADHAHLDHATDLTTFYGKPGEQARLWQGSDSVSAPVLELSRVRATLSAHGPAGEAAAVNAVFTSAPSSAKGPPAAPAHTGPAQTSVVRLQSRTLFYADAEHKAVFSGGVVAQTVSGVLHSSFMDVYFTPVSPPATHGPASPSPPGKTPEPQGSQVSKIVARQAVELQQPGRKGTGEELTYTAEDGKFVLTGTSATPPRLTDQVHGTVTGAALIFNDRDDSVVVSGGASKAETHTRVAR